MSKVLSADEGALLLSQGRLTGIARPIAAIRRYELVGAVAQALTAVDAASDAANETARALRAFSGTTSIVERCVASAAHRHRRLVWRSHGGGRSRSHAGHVVAAFRATEARHGRADALTEAAQFLVHRRQLVPARADQALCLMRAS